MFIEFIDTAGKPFTVSLLQIKLFRPQWNPETGNTVIVLSNSSSVIANSHYDLVKDRILAMTR